MRQRVTGIVKSAQLVGEMVASRQRCVSCCTPSIDAKDNVRLRWRLMQRTAANIFGKAKQGAKERVVCAHEIYLKAYTMRLWQTLVRNAEAEMVAKRDRRRSNLARGEQKWRAFGISRVQSGIAYWVAKMVLMRRIVIM